MDYHHYYRTVNNPGGCIIEHDQRELMNCIHYPIQNPATTDSSYEQFQANQGFMFFSQNRLRSYFKNSDKINSYLGCKCRKCEETRRETCPSNLPLYRQRLNDKIRENDGPLILASLAFLYKLHFIYKVPASTFKNLDGARDNIGNADWIERHFPHEQKLQDYTKAFHKVFGMLKPVLLKFKPESFHDFESVDDDRLFPFGNLSPIRTLDNIQKFDILEEYQDESIKDLIQKYPYSIEGIGNDKKFLFAIKSIELEGAPYANEVEILSRFTESKNENVIPLLACYVWRRRVYLVFPYIRRTLYDILHGDRPDASLRVTDSKPLPKNWLWKEMVRLTDTVADMHTGIRIPIAGQVQTAKVAHYDLKPNNVLVAAQKLKIIDFGHCLVMFAGGNGQDRSQATQGHPVYAPPETIRGTNESEGQHSKEVGTLNYDVWSLACIMVEVLVYICDIQGTQEDKTPIAQLGEALKTNALKEHLCKENSSVEDYIKIAEIALRFSKDEAHFNYKANVITLLNEMLDSNPCNRLSSKQVVERLQSIGSEFRKNYKDDEMGSRIDDYQPESPFVELAWKVDDREPIGFTTMDGIKLKTVFRHSQLDAGESTPCRIRIFKKKGNGNKRVLRIAYAQFHTGEVRTITMQTSDWCFQPTYLLRQNSKSCVIFKEQNSDADQESEFSVYVFTFQCLADICSFQGVFMDNEVIHTDKFPCKMKASITFTRRHGDEIIEVDNATVQFWTKGRVRDLKSINVNDFEQQQMPWLQIDTMTIITRERLIEVPMGDHRKKFHTSGSPRQIEATENKDTGHRHFFSYWYRALCPFGSNDGPYKIPSIQPGQSQILYDNRETGRNKSKDNLGCLKMTSMKITPEKDDEGQLMLAVGKEWKTGSGGRRFDPKIGKLALVKSSTA